MLQRQRLEALADGIFAIAMTILIFDVKVPQFLGGITTSDELWQQLVREQGVLLAYVLSFAVLSTYWQAHHFAISIYAKNLTRPLISLNFLFLFTIAFVPFTAQLLAAYHDTQLAVILYGIHVILISLIILVMFYYITHSKKIENPEHITDDDKRHAYTRILTPMFCGILAIVTSYFHTIVSIYIFIIAIIFNLIPGFLSFLDGIMDRQFHKDS